MKKIWYKINQVISIVFDSLVDCVFLIRLLQDLKYNDDDDDWDWCGYKINLIKVLLQFCAKSFDNAPFEYYSLNNEEYMHYFYLSLKNKNSSIFTFFCFWYCIIVCHTINPIIHLFISISYLKPFYKFEEKQDNWFNKQTKNNFGYEYLREYKKYYKNYPKSWNKIKYKVFFKETFLNLCIWWNNKTKINTDRIDIEKWF